MNVSHLGLRVRNIERVKRFYEALGFVEAKPLAAPDAVSGGLLGITPPIGFEAAYLENDEFVLQLLTLREHPAPKGGERTMIDAGLTHLSIAVGDMAEAQEAVRNAEGVIIAEAGFACMLRDPEGQLVELIHASVRPVLRARSRSIGLRVAAQRVPMLHRADHDSSRRDGQSLSSPPSTALPLRTQLVNCLGIPIKERQCPRRILATAPTATDYGAVEVEVAIYRQNGKGGIPPCHDCQVQCCRIPANLLRCPAEIRH